MYLDSNGNPQEVRVCFQSRDWAEPGATGGVFVSRKRNIMVVRGVTFSLAAAFASRSTDAVTRVLGAGAISPSPTPSLNSMAKPDASMTGWHLGLLQ